MLSIHRSAAMVLAAAVVTLSVAAITQAQRDQYVNACKGPYLRVTEVEQIDFDTYIALHDGSVWKVSSMDEFKMFAWLPGDIVVVVPKTTAWGNAKMFNRDGNGNANSTIDVTWIR